MNVVDIVLQGRDHLDPAFATAVIKASDLKREISAGRIALSSFASVASGAGATSLANLAGELGLAAAHAQQLSGALGKSMLARAGLVAGVATAGVAVGSWISSLFGTSGEFEDKATAFNDAMEQIQRKIQATKTEMRGGSGISPALQEVNDAIEKINRTVEAGGAFGAGSWLFGKAGENVENVSAMVNEYQKLRDSIIEAQAAASDEKTLKLWEQAKAGAGDLMRGSSFGGHAFSGGGSRGYSTFTPQQGQEFLQIQSTYDEMLKAFQKYTDDKNQIDEFQTQAEKARTQALKDFNIRLLDEESKKRRQILATNVSQIAGSLGQAASIAQAFGKSGFGLFKALSSAEALVSTIVSAEHSYAWGSKFGGPALGAALAAIATGAGLARVAQINAMKAPSGQAHAGMDFVPNEGSYNLQRGEMVLDPGTSDRVRELAYDGGGAGGGGQVIQVLLDGRVLLDAVTEGARNGLVRIHPRAVTTGR